MTLGPDSKPARKQAFIVDNKRVRLAKRFAVIGTAAGFLLAQTNFWHTGGKVVWEPNYDGTVKQVLWASTDAEQEVPQWVKQIPLFTLTTVFLTSGTSWTVPSDWNNASNTIECIGGGQNGAGTDGSGGQGGGYGKVTNQAASGSISIQVGTNGATATSSWWNSTATVRGKGGGSADTNVGSTTFAGGTGGSSAGGGGGAAGPNGAGGNGGGFNGSGGTGDNGSGGSGGTSGHAGGNGTEYDASHGSGGGGGGNSSGAGGAGGLYGGGGAGGFSAGSGAKGLIVVTYTPSGGGGDTLMAQIWM